MKLPLEELQNHDFALSGIQIYHQKPTFRKQQHRKRKLNGFVYLIRGKCRFSFDGGSILLEPGAVCYLPSGSNHTLEILEEGTSFYRVDFQLHIGGEAVVFSDGPLLLCSGATMECAEAIQKMADSCALIQNSVQKTECLCRVFRSLTRITDMSKRRRAAAAAEYLQAHFTERICCEELARLCNLGIALFYSVFREAYGVTPLTYRDNILMNRAKLLLQDGSFSVGEVADMLGFESAAYFSRFFKKHCGVPPSEYTAEQNGGAE